MINSEIKSHQLSFERKVTVLTENIVLKNLLKGNFRY